MGRHQTFNFFQLLFNGIYMTKNQQSSLHFSCPLFHQEMIPVSVLCFQALIHESFEKLHKINFNVVAILFALIAFKHFCSGSFFPSLQTMSHLVRGSHRLQFTTSAFEGHHGTVEDKPFG